MKNSDLSLIVYSCIKNKDMWPIFLTFFKKYWSDCDFKLILLTDYFEDIESENKFDDVICLDSDWSTMIRYAIQKTGTHFVMLFMDDYLLTEKVYNEDIIHYLNILKENNAVNIRLKHCVFSNYSVFSNELLKIISGSPYSLSLQIGIWNTSFLIDFIRDNWTPWDFERKGSLIKLDESKYLFETRKYSFPYVEAVRKGKWMPQGIKACQENNVFLDFQKRPAMSIKNISVMKIKALLLRLFPTTILRLQSLIKT